MRLTYKAALLFAFLFAVAGGSLAQAGEAKFEAQLIWATNDKKSPDPKHKDVDADVRKKLEELPLKWKNYFEVNRVQFTMPKGGTNRVVLSDKCTIEVKRLGDKKVEVSLCGKKGDTCYTLTQALPKDDILLFGGKAPEATAWFVTLKRIE